MTTTLDLIHETKRYLLASHREILNALNGAINSSTTTITFSHTMGSLVSGAVISVDLEIMYVWSADDAAKTAVVQRGFQGSTAASHATDALVTVNAKFPDFAVFHAINAELNDISGDLFQVVTKTFTYIPGKQGYDLGSTADPIAILDGSYDYPGISEDWPSLRWLEIRRNANLTSFPSGFAIIMKAAGFPGREVRVVYSAALSPLTSLTDDVRAVTGLDAGSHDIPALGAAIRLQGVREGQRNFNDNQSDTRRAAEVPTGAQIQSIRALVDFKAQRIRGDMKLLRQQYPYYIRIAGSG